MKTRRNELIRMGLHKVELHLVGWPDSTPSGTLADPIPYERLMVLEKGKYYTQFGLLYICTTDSIVGYDEDLAGLAALVTVANEE